MTEPLELTDAQLDGYEHQAHHGKCVEITSATVLALIAAARAHLAYRPGHWIDPSGAAKPQADRGGEPDWVLPAEQRTQRAREYEASLTTASPGDEDHLIGELWKIATASTRPEGIFIARAALSLRSLADAKAGLMKRHEYDLEKIASLRARVTELERQLADPIMPSAQAENQELRTRIATLEEALDLGERRLATSEELRTGLANALHEARRALLYPDTEGEAK
jgi:hypothetical protein